MKLVPHIKIWLSTDDGQNVIGNGRYQLLKSIDELGSLSAAAEQLNISYRKAWGDLKKAEASMDCKLTIKTRGGACGGKTELTPEGCLLLKTYTQLSVQIKQQAEAAYLELTESEKQG